MLDRLKIGQRRSSVECFKLFLNNSDAPQNWRTELLFLSHFLDSQGRND